MHEKHLHLGNIKVVGLMKIHYIFIHHYSIYHSCTIEVYTLLKPKTSLAPLSQFCGSRFTTAHAHQCCIFQSYVKTEIDYEIDDA